MTPAHDDGTVCNASAWNAVADQPHQRGFAKSPGRTHQLRVHCAAMGWPIVGDAIYGSAPRRGGPGLQLHARDVVVPLYKNRDPIRVAAPVPGHVRALLEACGWGGGKQ